jgi:hypothetical protein
MDAFYMHHTLLQFLAACNSTPPHYVVKKTNPGTNTLHLITLFVFLTLSPRHYPLSGPLLF